MATGRERVYEAIRLGTPDAVPKGELTVDEQLVRALTGHGGPLGVAQKAEALRALGMDLACVELGTQSDLEEIEEWAAVTDLFVFGIANGPFSTLGKQFGFMEFLVRLETDRADYLEAFREGAARLAQLGRAAAERGAHGIIIGDDIAYNGGTYVSPRTLREIYFPALKHAVDELRTAGIPVFFHSCGNLNAVLGDIVDLGVDGVHGLEPGAGMDVGHVKRAYGDRVCIMGNLDPAILITGPEEQVRQEVRKLVQAAAPGGGYIFGTCSGYLGEGMPLANVLAAYRAAGVYGRQGR